LKIIKAFLLLFFPLFLFATQYWISFQYTMKNNQIINEKFEYSKCMYPTNSATIKEFKYFNQYKNLKDIFKYEKENLIDMFSKVGVIMHNNQKIVNYYSDDKVKVTFLPRRFDIIFKDGYIIFKLKE